MKQWWATAKELLLPQLCPGCGEVIKYPTLYICQACQNSFERATASRIQREFRQSFEQGGLISGYYGMFLFHDKQPIANVIHAFKYDKKFALARYIGELLGKELLTHHESSQVDLIVPLPLHPLRYAERGYNQSAYLAEGISKIMRVPMAATLLRRIKNTPSQTGLNALERKENVAGAFALGRTAHLDGKHILLVDDVKTTGATFNECARVIDGAKSATIWAVSAAIAD
jgi:ComF family protein